MTDAWRYEADDEWLVSRRSTFFRRRRSRLTRAFADAELGPFGSSKRNPRLKLTEAGYSHVRYATREFSHTTIQVDLLECKRCGSRLLEEHRLVLTREDGAQLTMGWVRMCRHCEKEAWLFTSHMPTTVAGRLRDAKTVL